MPLQVLWEGVSGEEISQKTCRKHPAKKSCFRELGRQESGPGCIVIEVFLLGVSIFFPYRDLSRERRDRFVCRGLNV